MQVLVVKAEVPGRERGVGGVGEVLKEQEVSYWLPGENAAPLLVPRREMNGLSPVNFP